MGWMEEGGKKEEEREGGGERKDSQKEKKERKKGKLKNRSQKSSSNEQQSEYRKTDLSGEGSEGCCRGECGGHRKEMCPSEAYFSSGLAGRDKSGRSSKRLARPVAAHCLRLQSHIFVRM